MAEMQLLGKSEVEKSAPELINSDVRPQFGNRRLKAGMNVFDYNAWDDIEWGDEEEQIAKSRVAENNLIMQTPEEVRELEDDADKFWDSFYSIHTNKFFKDRNWLFTEFTELSDPKNKLIFEIGCGVGNTAFPILEHTKSREIMYYGCDFSKKAIDIFKENPLYNETCCNAFVLDITNDNWSPPFAENSIDIIIAIFALSAIHPKHYSNIVRQIYRFLKPGGILLFRDYGRYDLTQLRFKCGRSIGDNFYVRGDGTRVYFFSREDVILLLEENGFDQGSTRYDRRLQVNRARMVTMYRVWLQATYRKSYDSQ